ncbi:MAG: TrkA family potassium uptake protein [Candidatus Methanoperedens sp.]|nr:TrkA family potassium uptake protein [Candidatus Methanoperedens sp.]
MKRFILIGYGDVGRSIAQVLEKAHVNFVVIDKNEAKLKGKGFDFVAGDAADEEILKNAGVQTASTVIIVLNNDADIIFTTLVTRNLNPHSIILARANTTKSIDKIYRAGADYVASLSIVAGQMLAHIAIGHDEENIMMLEGLEIARHHITSGSPLVGKTIAEARIRSRIGCTIIGIEENGKTTTDVDPSIIIREGMTLAIIGNCEQISRFKEEIR